MQFPNAEQQKTYAAEKQIAIVRAFVIVFNTIIYFLLDKENLHQTLALTLIVIIWIYGAYVLLIKPYEKYPIFVTSWFTYIGDCVFTTLWIYATGGAESPFFPVYYISIIAVAFRFQLKITIFSAALYTAVYLLLLVLNNQIEGNFVGALVKSGFLFLIGYLTNIITTETLSQTEQKLIFQKLVEDAVKSREELQKNTIQLEELNKTLQLNNDIFRHAEENAEVGSYWWQLSNGKMGYSDNLFRLLDCEPGEFEPTFERYMEFVHPEEKEAAIELGKRTLETKQVEMVLRRMVTKTGKLKYIRTTGKFTGSGDELLLIGTLQDVSNDVRLQAAINSKNAELENTNNELSSFNYIASHDLQEPVRKIHTFGNMVLQKDQSTLSPGGKDYLNRIIAAASRMQKLIEAFSNYARIGNTTIVFEDVNLSELVESAKENLSEKIRESGAIITYDNLPIIKGSAFHIQQLLDNLLSNAIKYRSKDVTPLISVSVKDVVATNKSIENSKPDNYWKITVKDNGIGFNEKYSEKIFEVFQRLHSKEQYPGTGIGLAICKKVAIMHKGFVSVRSSENEGAEINIFICGSL